MAIKVYLQFSSPITAHLSGEEQYTADVNKNVLVKGVDWTDIESKPFETVDDETLSTVGGVLKFKMGSYNDLTDTPSIEDVALKGNKTFADLGMNECSILDIEKMFS